MESSICRGRSCEQNVDWSLMKEYIKCMMENNQFWLKSKWILSPRLPVWLRCWKPVTLCCTVVFFFFSPIVGSINSLSLRPFSHHFILCDYKCPTSELQLWALRHWQGASGGQLQDRPRNWRPNEILSNNSDMNTNITAANSMKTAGAISFWNENENPPPPVLITLHVTVRCLD